MKRVILIALLLAVASYLPGWAQERSLPKLDDGQVIMKWRDFEKILKELLKPLPKEPEPEPEPPPTPPVEYSFSSASFDVVIGKGFAKVEADYALDVLVDKKWITVPLGRTTSGIYKVLLDGKPALVSNYGGSISTLLLGKSAHRLHVSYTVTASQNPGPNSFQVPVASVPGATITLVAPSELSDIGIIGAVITNAGKSKEAWNIRAIAGATQNLNVSYAVPVPEALAAAAEKIPTKLYSSMELLVSIADEVTSVNAYFNYDIKHSPLSRFSVAVPDGYDVVNVFGQGTSGWKVDDGKLNVSVNYEVKGSYVLRVEFESKRESASGAVVIPEPKTIDAERESGFVAVETRSSLEVAIDTLDGLVPIDATELPLPLRRRARYPILYSFRFGRHPYAGSLSVTRHEEVEVLTAAIDTVNLVTLFTKDGKSVTRMIYEIRNNKKQYLKIDLPKNAKIWSAYLDDEPVKPSKNNKGQTLIPLKKSGSGDKKVSFTVELIYYSPIDEIKKRGKLKITFPKADIPASEMLLSLYLPPKYKYKDFEGDLEETVTEPVALDKSRIVTEAPVSAPVAGKKKETKGFLYSKRALRRQEQMEMEIADEISLNAPVVVEDQLRDLGQAVTTPARPTPRPRRGGMLPVKFSVPLRGTVKRFSKLLVMDEAPELTFRYRKRWKPIPWQRVWLVAKIIVWALVALVFISLIRRLFSWSHRKKEKAPTQTSSPDATDSTITSPDKEPPTESQQE